MKEENRGFFLRERGMERERESEILLTNSREVYTQRDRARREGYGNRETLLTNNRERERGVERSY